MLVMIKAMLYEGAVALRASMNYRKDLRGFKPWGDSRRMVGVSACVNLPLHHKVQKFSSGTGSPGWSRKKGHKTVVCVCMLDEYLV